jgi:hypothetical protein
MCDLNPLTRSVLATADAGTSFKLLALKMILVVVCGCLDAFPTVQVVIGLICVAGVSTFLFYDVSGWQLRLAGRHFANVINAQQADSHGLPLLQHLLSILQTGNCMLCFTPRL